MPGASGGGSSPKYNNSSPGSRYSLLSLDNNEFPPMQNSKRKRQVNEFLTNSFFEKSKKLCDLQQGPQYLILKRNETNKEITLSQVSCFLLQRAIENFAGAPKNVKRLRDGTVLIETIDKKQAETLLKMMKLSAEINVKVEYHPTLNTTKGTIYCPDLISINDEIILEELKDQKVVEIRRILKKKPGIQQQINNSTDSNFKKDNLVDTGVFVLTFNLPQAPKDLRVGIHKCDVKLYVPVPRRCFKCQRFGHGKLHCKSFVGTCGLCADIQHEPEKCIKPVKCVNCLQSHPTWSRECPKFQQEQEIQRIQTIDRVSNSEARKTFYNRNPSSNLFKENTYASISKENTQNSNATKTTHLNSKVNIKSIDVTTTKKSPQTVSKTISSIQITPPTSSKHNNEDTYNKQIQIVAEPLLAHNQVQPPDINQTSDNMDQQDSLFQPNIVIQSAHPNFYDIIREANDTLHYN